MADARELVSRLENLSPQEGLAYVSAHFNRVKFSTALGEEDQVITHLIASQNLSIEIFTLDTGRLFTEAYDLLAITNVYYNKVVKVYFPDHQDVEGYVVKNGINGFYDSVDNRKECCHLRKVKPLKRALADASIWVTGLRGSQSANRQLMKTVEWDESMQVIKYNPLLHWTDEELRHYIELNNIPTNPLHKKGFVSIGCAPCTRAIRTGEDSRAGRWWWESSAKECGLHSTNLVAQNK